MSLDNYTDNELKEELRRRHGIECSNLSFFMLSPKRYTGPHKFPTFKELSTAWGPYEGGAYHCKECGEMASTWSPGLESNTSDCPGKKVE